MKIIKVAYIYILTSPSGKKYIGQTTNFKKRFETYKNIRKRIHTQVKLGKALEKYGFENFIIETIEFNNITEEELDKLEIDYIKKHDSYNNGYNCTIGGGGKRVHCSEEERILAVKKSALKYKILHPDRIKESKLKYNRSEIGQLKQKESYKKRYLNDKKQITEYNKLYIQNNKEEHLARRRKYHELNKEKENARCREYYNKKKKEKC